MREKERESGQVDGLGECCVCTHELSMPEAHLPKYKRQA